MRFMSPLVILWLVPIVAFVLLMPRIETTERATLEPGTSSMVRIGERIQEYRRPVRVEVELSEAPVVIAAGGGLVTAVSAAAGAPIVQGARIADLDGVGVVASIGGTPFYRDLAVGDSGADVRQLKILLDASGVGKPEQNTSRYTPRTETRVKELQASLGAEVDGVFKRASVWFVPDDFTVAADIRIRPGKRLSEGDVVLVSSQNVKAMTFVADDPNESLEPLTVAPLVLSVGGEHIDVSSLSPSIKEARMIWRGLERISPASPGDGGVGGTEESTVQTYAGLSISLAQPIRVGTAPRSAFFSSASGAVCIFARSRNGAGIEAVPLPHRFATGYDLDTAQVPEALIGREVMVDSARAPLTVSERCG